VSRRPPTDEERLIAALEEVPFTDGDWFEVEKLCRKWPDGVDVGGVTLSAYHAVKARKAAWAYGMAPAGWARNLLAGRIAADYRTAYEARVARIEAGRERFTTWR